MPGDGKIVESTQACGNCRFWLPKSLGSVEGTCRRYPRRVIFDGLENKFAFAQPPCSRNDWCGEWQAAGNTPTLNR